MPPRPAHRRKRDPLRNAQLAPRPHTCDEQCTHPVRAGSDKDRTKRGEGRTDG